ncbi:hypothetical protein [Streptomyces sp. XY593]|uniref:hypothetical protein n=1 Tax=Streptomyces sp. XY593 TaxID=1519483 RepID=UPI00131AFA60|nr:hypothetical protein [Streptomyces sp. XY593]
MSEEPELTAAQLVVTVPQPDDSGANTLDRYDWQAAMAAADGLQLYLKSLGAEKRLRADEDRRILCEFHEDWVAIQGDDAELVSGKHREESVGAFTTINQLADDGGIAHLFLRWHALSGKPTCRVATTAGLAAGEAQKFETTIRSLRAQRLGGLDIAASAEHIPYLKKMHSAIRVYGAKHLPKSWTADGTPALSENEQLSETAHFLSMLTIQAEEIRRSHLVYAAPSMYAKPVVEHLGYDVPPESVWNAVHGIFRTRMRAAGPRPEGALPPVLAYMTGAGLPGPAESERSLSARIVTMQDIDLAVMTAVANPSAYESLSSPMRMSRAAVKMRKGDCSPNSIERGEQLRKDYQGYWRSRMSGDPSAMAERDSLRRLLLRISDQNDTPDLRATEPWGAELWLKFRDATDEIAADKLPAGMDSDLLLGGIVDLTNACQIWFSDNFDVAAEIDRVRDRNNGSATQ